MTDKSVHVQERLPVVGDWVRTNRGEEEIIHVRRQKYSPGVLRVTTASSDFEPATWDWPTFAEPPMTILSDSRKLTLQQEAYESNIPPTKKMVLIYSDPHAKDAPVENSEAQEEWEAFERLHEAKKACVASCIAAASGEDIESCKEAGEQFLSAKKRYEATQEKYAYSIVDGEIISANQEGK